MRISAMQNSLLLIGLLASGGAAGFCGTMWWLDNSTGGQEQVLTASPQHSELTAGKVNSLERRGENWLLTSGFDKLPSSGGVTGGAYLTLTGEQEKRLSGKSARIEVIAALPAGAAPHKFAIAYSTAEVGNSGWRPFEVQTSEPQVFGFDWPVPASPNPGRGNDFIGILGDFEGRGRALEVREIRVLQAKE